MATRLVYHPPSVTDDVSPFDECAVLLATDSDLLIACPYLTLSYLKDLTECCARWQLLTDIHKWYSSLTVSNRRAASRFLTHNAPHVRHWDGLHAKVLVGTRGALVGSANFTNHGIIQNTEMGVFLDGEEEIRELRKWFLATWKNASAIPTSRLSSLERLLPSPTNTKPSERILPPTHTLRARFCQRSGSTINGPEIRDVIASFEDGEWLDDHRQLVRILIDHLGIESGDPRLVMSIPKRRSGWLLPVSINNRYVVVAGRRAGENIVGVIHTPDFKEKDYFDDRGLTYGRFDPLKGEDEDETPYFIKVPSPHTVLRNPQFLGAVLAAAERELGRASASPYRKYHSDDSYAYMVSQPAADGTNDD